MEFRRIIPGHPGDLAALVKCYQRVFATEPWGEWRRCTVCERHWGIEDQAALEAAGYRHHRRQVAEFWPAERVEGDLARELALPGASCWVACDQGQMVGFAHGYAVAIADLDQHLGLDGVATTTLLACGTIDQVGYQDELGVVSGYRGRGLAHDLFRLRLADFRAHGLTVGVVRTMSQPPTVTFKWYQSLAYRIVGEYLDSGGRVVMARNFDGLT